MNINKPGLPHASTERLCDYELPDLQALAGNPMPPLFPDFGDGGNWGLSWWLWMDDVGKRMLKPYDQWRERLHHGDRPPTDKPGGR